MVSAWSAQSALAVVTLTLVSAAADEKRAGPATEGIDAVTRPSQEVALSFPYPGLIREVRVEDGDRVTAGSILAMQDDTVERIQLEQLQATAANETRIRMAEARLKQKRLVLEHLKRAASREAASVLEVAQAEMDEELARLTLAQEQFDHEQAVLEHHEAQVRLERLMLKSPIAGRVDRVLVHRGEGADRLEDVVRLLQTDPLWIDVPVPLSRVAGLRSGGVARVRFPGEEATVEGRILHVGLVADSASETLTVRVEVPNPSDRPAGEAVKVSLP